MTEDHTTHSRVTPRSGLDFNLLLTDTMWGSALVSDQIKERIESRDGRMKMLGNLRAGDSTKDEAWGLLAYYTRDLRLANLNVLTGELAYCQHYIDLAGDLLREGYTEAFATSLSRAATILELSQSKGGFLRKRQNTLTTENLTGEVETKKKRLLFPGKQQG